MTGKHMREGAVQEHPGDEGYRPRHRASDAVDQPYRPKHRGLPGPGSRTSLHKPRHKKQ